MTNKVYSGESVLMNLRRIKVQQQEMLQQLKKIIAATQAIEQSIIQNQRGNND